MTITPDPPLDAVRALLRASELPVDDVAAAAADQRNGMRFFGWLHDGRLRAVVGLEYCGGEVLLRSLAVEPAARRSGAGSRLLAHAETRAGEHGSDCVYLLTETAEAFFARRGYRELARELAPETIRTTREFSGLCPDSATFMCKHLTPTG